MKLTLRLNSTTSSSVNVSALAMTGMRLTLVCSRRMNSISIGLRLEGSVSSDQKENWRIHAWPVGWIK